MNLRVKPLKINPVITATSYILAHVPNMVRYGSKPVREIQDQGNEFWKKAELSIERNPALDAGEF